MKKSIAILLVLSICFQHVVKVAIVGYYLINKEYISKYLCENRFNPKSCCEGKCQLKKQLAKDESKEKKQPVKLRDAAESIVVLPDEMPLMNQGFLAMRADVKTPYRFSIVTGTSSSIFHPPEA